LAALLVIDHKLNRDARAARPARVGRVAAVAGEIAGILGEMVRGQGVSIQVGCKRVLQARPLPGGEKPRFSPPVTPLLSRRRGAVRRPPGITAPVRRRRSTPPGSGAPAASCR